MMRSIENGGQLSFSSPCVWFLWEVFIFIFQFSFMLLIRFSMEIMLNDVMPAFAVVDIFIGAHDGGLHENSSYAS